MSTILIDADARPGYFETKNAVVDQWVRIIGPTAFTILCTFKRFCSGNEEKVFANVKQQDWAEYIGISLQTFKSHLRILKKHNLLQIIPPKGSARLSHQPYKYILNPIEDAEIKEKDLPAPLSEDNPLNDPIYNPERNLFKKITPPDYIKNIYSGENKKYGPHILGTVNKNTVKDLKDISPNSKNYNSTESKKQTSATKIYQSLSEQLKDIVSSINKITLGTRTHQWASHFRKLNEIDKVPFSRIREVLKWYEEHIGEEFVPECYSAESFRIKFNKLESAMERSGSEKKKKTPKRIGTAKPQEGKYKNILRTVVNSDTGRVVKMRGEEIVEVISEGRE